MNCSRNMDSDTSPRGNRLAVQWITLAVATLWCATAGYARQIPDHEPLPEPIRELLSTHCLDCHDSEVAEAGLDLSLFRTAGGLRRDTAIWKHVAQRVSTHNMPPPDVSEIGEEERRTLVAWVERVLTELDCTSATAPGSVTIRRLNRREYRNSIADALLVDYQPASDFPGDDVGYGFDNIGDVLSLPPVLMEKYLNAAEVISRQVIEAPEDRQPVDWQLPINQWRVGDGVRSDESRLHFYSNGTADFEYESARSQNVKFVIRAIGQQAGDDKAKFSFLVDRKRIRQFAIESDEETETFEIAMRLSKGRRRISLSFDNDYYRPEAADAGERDRNLAIQEVRLILTDPAAIEPSPAQANFFFAMPARESEALSTARQLTVAWASRLYRRVVSAEEAQRLVALYETERSAGASFERAMQTVLQAMLVSPHFLYKVELPSPADGRPRPLTSFELATCLSFFLWNGPPDVELLRVALREDLQDDDILRREMERMLASEKFDRAIDDFVGQWLHLRLLDRMEPDPELFPGADRELLRDMQRETQLFCRDIIRNDGSLIDLIEARHSFVNDRLANHYGLEPSGGGNQDFYRIEWPAGDPHGGLMTQASVLTLTSNPTRTSPVKRGRWILDNLLGEPPPPPPADAQPLEEQELVGTLREKMEQHRSNPACATCHAQMDALGFAFEQFDAVGRWRESEDGSAIDASGELPGGIRFNGSAELRQLLLATKRDQYLRCVSEKMMTYALGRGLDHRDQCAVTEIVDRVSQHDYRISELIWGIVSSAPFRQRQIKLED